MSLSKATLELLGTTNSVNLILNINDTNNSEWNDFSPNNYTNSSYTFTFQTTEINLNPVNVPTKYEIQTFPNPFNGITIFHTTSQKNRLKKLQFIMF